MWKWKQNPFDKIVNIRRFTPQFLTFKLMTKKHVNLRNLLSTPEVIFRFKPSNLIFYVKPSHLIFALIICIICIQNNITKSLVLRKICTFLSMGVSFWGIPAICTLLSLSKFANGSKNCALVICYLWDYCSLQAFQMLYLHVFATT